MLTPDLKLVPILQKLLSYLLVEISSSVLFWLSSRFDVQSLNAPNFSVSKFPGSVLGFRRFLLNFFE